MDARGDGSFVANLQLDGRGSRQAIITCTLLHLHQTVKAQPRRIRFIQIHIHVDGEFPTLLPHSLRHTAVYNRAILFSRAPPIQSFDFYENAPAK
jgi:hypothetical protein